MAGLLKRLLGGRREYELASPEAIEMPPLAVERPVAILCDLRAGTLDAPRSNHFQTKSREQRILNQ